MSMTEEITTTDLSQFGFRELKMAAELLHAYVENPEILGDGVQVMMNRNSGYVFLTDENFDTAMMNGHRLELWLTCGECGEEGFAEDFSRDEDGTGHVYDGNDLHHLNGPEGFCELHAEKCLEES